LLWWDFDMRFALHGAQRREATQKGRDIAPFAAAMSSLGAEQSDFGADLSCARIVAL